MQRTISLSVFVVSLLLPLSAHARVVVSELLWSGSDRSTADEWIELAYLREDGEPDQRSMSGWTLTTLASDAEQVMVRFGSGLVMNDGDILLIANDHADTSRLSIEADIVTTSVSLPNTKLLVRLRDETGGIVDQVDDGVGVPMAGANPSGGPKASMERIDLLASGTGSSNWRTATESQNFDDGLPIFGTPGVIVILSIEEPVTSSTSSSSSSSALSSALSSISSSVESSTGSGSVTETGAAISSESSISMEPLLEPIRPPHIYITEVLSDPIGADAGEWIEIWNAEQFDVSLAGLSVEKVGSSTSYQFPLSGTGVVLPAGGYLSVHRDVTGITLDNEGADIVLRWNGEYLDALRYDKTGPGISVGRSNDDLLSTRPYCVPTEAEPNRDLDLDPQIGTQSLVVHDDGSVAVNLVAQLLNGEVDTVSCDWDYGDGSRSDSCNPPSHTIKESGAYSVILSMTSYCGNTVIRTFPLTVQRQSSSSVPSSSDGDPGRRAEADDACRASAASGVVIDRLLPRPETGDEERVILRNITTVPVDLCGWSVDDADGGSRSYRLDGRVIPPRDTLEVTSEESGIHWNDSGDSVRLFAPVEDGQLLVEDISYGEAESGIWLVRGTNGSFDWEIQETQSVLAGAFSERRSAAWDELRLQRVMPHPNEGTKEWVEIRSVADGPRSLSGWLLDLGTKTPVVLQGVIDAMYSRSLSGTMIKLRDTDGVVRLVAPDGYVAGIAAWPKAQDDIPVAALALPPLQSGRMVGLTEEGRFMIDDSGVTVNVELSGVLTPFSSDWPLAWDEGKMKYIDSIGALIEDKNIEYFLDDVDTHLGRIFVKGREVQDVLLTEGLAVMGVVSDADLHDVYDALEGLAKSGSRGLWSLPEQSAAIAASRKISVATPGTSVSKKRSSISMSRLTRRSTTIAPSLKLTAATLSPKAGQNDSISSLSMPSKSAILWLLLGLPIFSVVCCLYWRFRL